MSFLILQMIFAEVGHVGGDVFAIVEGGVVLGGDDEVGIVLGGELAEGAFVLAEMAVVAHSLVGGGEAVYGEQLGGVGEEESVDFVAGVGVVLAVEVGDTVLEFGGFDGAVVDDDDDVVLLAFAEAVDEGFGGEVVVDDV